MLSNPSRISIANSKTPQSTKERALARTTPTGIKPGRYKPTSDKLLAFLQGL